MKASPKFNKLRTLTVVIIAIVNNACTVVGPDYKRPAIEVPPVYKETSEFIGPQQTEQTVKLEWWKIYHDNVLDDLMIQLDFRNFSLRAVEAKMQQARELANIAKASQSPMLAAGGRNDLGILASWEIDLWGRIKRTVEAGEATAQATVADVAAAILSLQAQLAQNYFLLRVEDADISLLQDTVAAYKRSLQITRNQHAVGVVGLEDIAQAQAQLSTAQVQSMDAQILRAHLEHAIAVLVGKSPANFTLEIAPINIDIPQLPPTLPSELLQRRPDIAAAERRMAAASAQIGVAVAEAYPSLSLSAGASIAKGVIGGSDLVAPLYSAGGNQAKADKANAAYTQVVADYRQLVLNSFREVEDNLVTLKILSKASESQAEAVKATRKAVAILKNQYKVGIVNYQSIIIVQASALINERGALSILSRRLVASVTLIKALGGGWDTNSLNNPNIKQGDLEHNQ